MTQANVVQAEFFHVGGDTTKSIDQLLSECAERITENTRIKTVVRFLDTSGDLTKLALESEKLKEEIHLLFERYGSAGKIHRFFISHKLMRLHRRTSRHHLIVHFTAVKDFCTALGASPEKVAVEEKDFHFRFCCEDEIHELSESVRKSKNVWLFVFQPNSLLADTNVGVASYM